MVKSCCIPTVVGSAESASADSTLLPGAPAGGPQLEPDGPNNALARPAPALVRIAGGPFTMGSDASDVVADDGEGPARRVVVSDFAMAPTTVTNREFADFVRATRYVTDAERLGSSFVFYLQVPEAARQFARQVASGLPWWLPVENASWQRPEGPGSHVHARPDHPVVHVSWHDCMAFCAWTGTNLPSEAQWECAARGGLVGRTFPWGDALMQDGMPRCNVWRGEFPNAPATGWHPAPVSAAIGEPNGFGLHHMCGNVWEWCADWFSATYHAATAAVDPVFTQATGRRSLRGGSFLCHDSYCNRYRVSARSSNTPESAASNVGFRVVNAPPSAPPRHR